jgi:hypothetical protein
MWNSPVCLGNRIAKKLGDQVEVRGVYPGIATDEHLQIVQLEKDRVARAELVFYLVVWLESGLVHLASPFGCSEIR